MPSLQDIADQIDASLNQLNANTAAIRTDTTEIRTELSQVDDHLESGVATLADGLFAILEQERRANSIAVHQVAQNDTIICWLDNIAELLCGMTRKLTQQVDLQDRLVLIGGPARGHRRARARPRGRGVRPRPAA